MGWVTPAAMPLCYDKLNSLSTSEPKWSFESPLSCKIFCHSDKKETSAIYVHVHTYIHMYIPTSMYVHKHACAHLPVCTNTHTYTHVHIMHAYINIHGCTHKHTYTWAHKYTYTCTHTYTHYTYTYVHTLIHVLCILIRICTLSNGMAPQVQCMYVHACVLHTCTFINMYTL